MPKPPGMANRTIAPSCGHSASHLFPIFLTMMNPDGRTEQRAYLFGDNDLAAARLALLAEVFAPSSREFLQRFGGWRPRRICDVGCGPGLTTRLLAETFAGSEVVGVDTSEQFLRLAEQT